MASELDKHLRPGERVVWRHEDWPAGTWSFDFGFMLGLVFVALVLAKPLFDWSPWPSLALAAATPAVFWRLWIQRSGWVAAAVTEERFIQADQVGEIVDFLSLGRGQVTGVGVVGAAVVLTRRDGRSVVLEHRRNPRDVATALAGALGLPPPPAEAPGAERARGAGLDQFLRPRERVLYRTPRDWLPPSLRREWPYYLALAGLLYVFNVTTLDREGLSRLFYWLFLFAWLGGLQYLRNREMEAAVTERRVLRVGARNEPLLFQGIELDEIAAVEVGNRGIRVTRKSGAATTLIQPEYGAELGLALAAAAGVAAPRLPDPLERQADIVVAAAGAGGFLAVFLGAMQALLATGFFPIAFPLCLVPLGALFVVGFYGWLGGEVLGLLALRRLLGREALVRWLREYQSDPDDPPKPGGPGWFIRWRRRLAAFACGAPAYDALEEGP